MKGNYTLGGLMKLIKGCHEEGDNVTLMEGDVSNSQGIRIGKGG